MVRIIEAAYGVTLGGLVLSTAILIALLVWHDIDAASSTLDFARM